MDNGEIFDVPESYAKTVDIEEFFDENAIYAQNNIEDLGTSPQKINLHKLQDDDRGGAVKSNFRGDLDDRLVYDKNGSNCYITAERLATVDGWRETIGEVPDRRQEDELTLVVLKLGFSPTNPESQVGFAITELRFHSEHELGSDPEVVAWGPFRDPEAWNPSTAQSKVNLKSDFRVAAGGFDQEISAGRSSEKETSWEKVDFDEGSSCQLFSHKKGGAHGVRWTLKQNKLYKHGIPPELRVAVLISRPQSMRPYLMSLRIEAHTGTIRAWYNRTQQCLGFRGGKTTIRRVTPTSEQGRSYFGEGKHFARFIDAGNLGSLIKSTSKGQTLDHAWLRSGGHFEIRKIGADSTLNAEHKITISEESASDGVGAEAKANLLDDASLKTSDRTTRTIHAAAGVRSEAHTGKIWPTGGGAQDLKDSIGDHDLFVGPTSLLGIQSLEYSRLLSLESRATQAEARLAVQDQLILRLQQALVRMEQRMREGGSEA